MTDTDDRIGRLERLVATLSTSQSALEHRVEGLEAEVKALEDAPKGVNYTLPRNPEVEAQEIATGMRG